MKLSKIISEYRKKRELTLEQLSSKSDLSRSYISKLENGGLDDQNVSLATIIKLANGLSIKVRDVMELLDITEPINKEPAPLKVYLRNKYNISDDNDVKIIESLIDHLKEK
jgi:transcriptional regulator with XRE-family HTH domain